MCRKLLLAISLLGVLGGLAGIASGRQTAHEAVKRGYRCTRFRARDFSRPSRTIRYGAYVVRGHVSCGIAVRVLRAVIDGRAVLHDTGTYATSYATWHGWACPGGHMGAQTCQRGARPRRKPTTEVLALSCVPLGSLGCPRHETGF